MAGARDSTRDRRADAAVRDGLQQLAQINVLDAAPQVLAALPNITPESLQSVLSQRGDPAHRPAVAGRDGGRRGGDALRLQGLPDTVDAELLGRAAQRRGGRGSASRKRRGALSCIVVAQRFRRVHGAAKGLFEMNLFKDHRCDAQRVDRQRGRRRDRRAGPRGVAADRPAGGRRRMAASRSRRPARRTASARASRSPTARCPAPNLASAVQGQPGRDRAAAQTLPVPSARTAGARGGLPRRYRARADRPPDAVERQ